MDAIEYKREFRRLCIGRSCNECVVFDEAQDCCIDSIWGREAEAVAIIEKWAAEHSVMTNRKKFKEVFGVEIENVGYLQSIGDDFELWNDDSDYLLGRYNQWQEDIDAIRNLPSAERHSRRKVFYHGENTWSYVCEACGTHIDEGDTYCRGCGAKMEE